MRFDPALCPWEEIHGFVDRHTFEKCTLWLEDQIRLRTASPISPPNSGIDYNPQDRWVLHRESQMIWRLLWPEMITFTGAFKAYIPHFNDTWTQVTIIHDRDYLLMAQWMRKQIDRGVARQDSGVGFRIEEGLRHADGSACFYPGKHEGTAYLQWEKEQHQQGYTQKVSFETPLEGTFVQIQSGQIWSLEAPGERGQSGSFRRIHVSKASERVALVRFLLKKQILLLWEDKSCPHIAPLAQILDLAEVDQGGEASQLEVLRRGYLTLIMGGGTFLWYAIQHDDPEMQSFLRKCFKGAIRETCVLLLIPF